MKGYQSFAVYRFVLILGGVGCLILLASMDSPGLPVAILGLVLGIFSLWMFVGLCSDIREIRNYLYSFEPAESKADPYLASHANLSEAIELGAFGSKAPRQLGDRVFKANATKTCTTCKHLVHDDKICDLDDISLEGVTISAVGCQHWELGLTVTETVESKEPDQLEGNSETSDFSPDQK